MSRRPSCRFPPWMARVAGLDPQRGYFAHDLLTYEPDPADRGHPLAQ